MAQQAPEADEDTGAAQAASTDALYARATELKIKGRSKMNRDDLEAAVAAAEKALQGTAAAAAAVALPGAPVSLEQQEQTQAEAAAKRAEEAEKKPEGEPELQPTPEQVNKVTAAATSQLEAIAGDPDLQPHLRRLVVAELQKRTEKARGEAALKQAQGRMGRFKVTKGGRYVTKDGFPTEIATGSILTDTSYDLEHVAKQGIQFERATSVRTAHDELGNQRTEAH